MKIKLLAMLAGVGVLFAGPAHAVFINGTISFDDGFDEVPSPPDLTCIVDCGDLYDINNVVNAYTPGSGTGDFAATATAAAFDIDAGVLPFVIYTTDTGYSFTLSSYVLLDSSPLDCDGGLCVDSVEYAFAGLVSGPGFDDTSFIGRWTANGSCIQAGNGCADGSQSASWSSSVTALGRVVVTTEPGSLALLGFSLIGLGLIKRRKAS